MSGEQRIDELVPSEPQGTEPVSEGDDQIRGIKSALEGTFPNFLGLAGSETQVTQTEEEINNTGRIDFGENVTVQASWTFTFQLTIEGTLAMKNNQTITSEILVGTQVSLFRLDASDVLQINDNGFNLAVRFNGTGLVSFEGDVNIETGTLDVGGALTADSIVDLNGVTTIDDDFFITTNGNFNVGANTEMRYGNIIQAGATGQSARKVQIFNAAGVSQGFMAIFPL